MGVLYLRIAVFRIISNWQNERKKMEKIKKALVLYTYIILYEEK